MKNLFASLRVVVWLTSLPILLSAQHVIGQYITPVITTNPDYADPLASPAVLLETDNLLLSRYPTDTPTRLKLLFRNETRSDLTFTLRNERQTVLFRDQRGRRINAGWWVLDLSELPEGRYTMQLRAGNEQAERTFTIGASQPVIIRRGPDVAFD